MGSPGARGLISSLVLGCAMAAAWSMRSESSRDLAIAAHAPAPLVRSLGTKSAAQRVIAGTANSAQVATAANAERRTSPSAYSALHGLLSLDIKSGMAAHEWRAVQSDLTNLLRLGRAAVPDIRAYLLSGDDILFHAVNGEPIEDEVRSDSLLKLACDR